MTEAGPEGLSGAVRGVDFHVVIGKIRREDIERGPAVVEVDQEFHLPAAHEPLEVGLIEGDDATRASADAAAALAREHAEYDYVWLTSRTEREDPCAAFTMPARAAGSAPAAAPKPSPEQRP